MIYPVLTPSKKNTVNVPDFTGGINLSENQTDIKDNQLVDAQNLRIDNGTVRTREALTLVDCNNFEVTDSGVVDVCNSATLYLSNTLFMQNLPETEESYNLLYFSLGYYPNNEYIFKVVLFEDKISAVCIYSAVERTTGLSKGTVVDIEFDPDRSDIPMEDLTNEINFKKINLISDVNSEPIIDSFNSNVFTNTASGYIISSEDTERIFSINIRLLNSDGEFAPTYTLFTRLNKTENLYIPTTTINKDNSTYLTSGNILAWRDVSGGTPFEDFNLLTTRFKETFYDRTQLFSNNDVVTQFGGELTNTTPKTDGASRVWNVALSTPFVKDSTMDVRVIINGVFYYTSTEVSYKAQARLGGGNGRFYLLDENDIPIEDCIFNTTATANLKSGYISQIVKYGNNNLQILFRCVGLKPNDSWYSWLHSAYIESIEIIADVESTALTDNIYEYSLSEWFGGARSGLAGGTRLFVAGSASKPNMIRWSALNDVSYFPENNFAIIGRGDEPITAIAKQSNFLAVFTPNSLWAVEYAYDTNSSTNATTVYFPTTPISPQFGCDCPNTIQLVNDKLTWAHSKGAIYTLVNQNQFSERNVREISAHIRPLLQVEGDNLKTALSADYKGQYIIFAGLNAYVWDYEQASLYNYSSSEKSQERLVFLKWVLPIAPSAVFSEKNSLSIYAEVEVDGQFAQRLFEFDDAESDESIDETGDIEVPITTSFKTKLWDFGLPHIFKRIMRLFFGLGSDYDFTASLAYTTDIGTMDSGSTISNEGNFNKGDDVFVIHTNIGKARTVQFEVETDTPIKLNSLQVEYSLLGEVK